MAKENVKLDKFGIRPDEPGIWWYKNNYDGEIEGALVGRPYDRRSGQLMVFHREDDGWSDFDHFEKCEVKQWLGIAVFKFVCRNGEVMKVKDIDHELTDEIVCPYCGYEFSESYEYSDLGLEECEECEECGKKFLYRRIVTIEYSTKQCDCVNGEKPHKWNSCALETEFGVVNRFLYRCKLCDEYKTFDCETREEFESIEKL